MYKAKIKKQSCDEQIIGVYDQQDKEVGDFRRNYGSYGVETFAEFERDGKWYALYSPSYVALSVMELPSCTEVLPGEDKEDGRGYCPVEIYIPKYQIHKDRGYTPEELVEKHIPECNWHWVGRDRYEREYDTDLWNTEDKIYYEDFCLCFGCPWACPYGITAKDISQAHLGIITDIKDFPYLDLPPNYQSLKDCVQLNAFHTYEPHTRPSVNVTLTVQQTIRLGEGFEVKIFD